MIITITIKNNSSNSNWIKFSLLTILDSNYCILGKLDSIK